MPCLAFLFVLPCALALLLKSNFASFSLFATAIYRVSFFMHFLSFPSFKNSLIILSSLFNHQCLTGSSIPAFFFVYSICLHFCWCFHLLKHSFCDLALTRVTISWHKIFFINYYKWVIYIHSFMHLIIQSLINSIIWSHFKNSFFCCFNQFFHVFPFLSVL